jgi:MFS family permease
MFFGLVLFLVRVWGYSILRAGVAITPGPLSVVPVAIVAGRRGAKKGHRGLLLTGGLIYAAGALVAFGTPAHPAFWAHLLPVLILTGIGVGLIIPSLSGAAVHGLPAGRFGIGSAVHQAIRQVGSVLGVALVIALVSSGTGLQPFFRLFTALIVGGLATSLLGLGVDTRPVPVSPSRLSERPLRSASSSTP